MNHFRQGIKNIPEICTRMGVRKVVIAPGSRNAPLIFAFTSQPGMECLSITDERAAAYFALGMSQQCGEAVALVCTSGTAVLNFAPAIAEAYYQHIPLLVFTADRPAEMIDQADGQTLRQQNIFGNYIKASFELPVDTVADADLYFSDRQVSQAIDTAINYPPGPVQINVPLREPIYTAIPDSHSEPKIMRTLRTTTTLHPDSLAQLQQSWMQHKRKMVVLGIFPKEEALCALAQQLAAQPDIVVVAENLSNVAGGAVITQPEPLFSRINSWAEAEAFAPDLLITIGHSVICKQLKIFLRAHQPQEQWQLQSSMPYVDTYQSLTTIIPAPATEVLPLMPQVVVENEFAALYREQMNVIGDLHRQNMEDTRLSDKTVTRELLRQIDSGTALHLANSTSVRWTQLFPAREDLTYMCNRGTSGIDGSLSTAAGYTYVSEEPVVFLTGDLSFIYDSNGLWNKYVGANLKIVVMNNNGGNIFRFIGDKELMKQSLEFFTTPHQVNIKALVEGYGLDYLVCAEMETLSQSVDKLLKTKRATVLEVFTDSDLNTENYKGYFRLLRETSQKTNLEK